MINKEDKLVEDKWYHVHLEDDYYEPIKVMGKLYFVGRLVVHLGNKILFNLNNDNGSVILPFEKIKWMVPLYNPEVKEDYLWE